MQYKDLQNNLHALDSDKFEGMLPKGSVPITDAEAAVITASKVLPPTQEQQDVVAARANAKLTALRNMTPAQVAAFVDANVTNLAQAQDAIKTLAIAVSILARRL